MKIFRLLAIPVLTFISGTLSSQTVQIHGSGPGYKNTDLKFFVQTDPVTKKLKPVLKISCDENGQFKCDIPCKNSEVIFIKTGIYNLQLFSREHSSYDILLPQYSPKPGNEDQNPFFPETELIPQIVNDKHDQNNLIREFDSVYNPVFNLVADYVFRNYNKNLIQPELSNLDRFTEIKEQPFYSDYIKCRKMMLGLIVSSSLPNLTSAYDLLNSGFKSDNPAFLELAEQLFSGYFTVLSSGKLKDLLNSAVNKPSLTELRSVIISDKKISEKELADYAILLNLYSDYYDQNIPGQNVRKLISEMASQGESEFIKTTALEIQSKIDFSLQGNSLPDFSLPDVNGKMTGLRDFRGKYLLLGFARSDNPPSFVEMGIIKNWYNKFSKDLQVAIILTDRVFRTAVKSMISKGFNWTFLDGSENDKIEFVYDLKMYPSFILLDREGKIISNPSLYPSEALELTINKILERDSKHSDAENR